MVALSHLHYDHIADATILQVCCESRQGDTGTSPARFRCIPATPRRSDVQLQSHVCHAVSQGDSIEVGEMRVTFFEVCHPSPVVRCEFRTSGIISYSGDTRRCDGILEAAMGADIFLCEASATEEDREFAVAGHLTARQAGEIAIDAGVKRLLLTHIWPLYDERVLLEECRSVFADAEIVRQGATYRVGTQD